MSLIRRTMYFHTRFTFLIGWLCISYEFHTSLFFMWKLVSCFSHGVVTSAVDRNVSTAYCLFLWPTRSIECASPCLFLMRKYKPHILINSFKFATFLKTGVSMYLYSLPLGTYWIEMTTLKTKIFSIPQSRRFIPANPDRHHTVLSSFSGFGIGLI